MALPRQGLLSFRSHGLVADTIRTGFWYGMRVVAQIAYLAAIGRGFGAWGLGAFAGVMALGGFLAPLASVGLGTVLIRKASQTSEHVIGYRNRALAWTLPCGLLLFGAGLLLAREWFPSKLAPGFLALLLLSEVLVTGMLGLCNSCEQALGVPHRSQSWSTALWLLRLGLLLPGLRLGIGMMGAAALHLLSGVAILAAALAASSRPLPGLRDLSAPLPAGDLREGLGYAASSIANVAFSDLNQSLVLGLLSAHEAGIFSGAYKLIVASMLPASVLALASMKRLFEAAHAPSSRSTQLMRTFTAAGFGLGAVSSVAVWLMAGFLPDLLGPDFNASVALARTLSVIPMCIAGRTVAVSLLTSQGRQSSRLLVEWAIIPLGLGANYFLTRHYGLDGLIYGIFGMEIATSATLFAMTRGLLRRSPR